MAAKKTGYHQESVPVEKYKFDPEADRIAQETFDKGPSIEISGSLVRTSDEALKARNLARVKAQMASHRNPKNRG